MKRSLKVQEERTKTLRNRFLQLTSAKPPEETSLALLSAQVSPRTEKEAVEPTLRESSQEMSKVL